MSKRGSILTEKVGRPPLELPKGTLVGAHMSIAGGTWKAVERAAALGATATQLFVKNASRWEGKRFEPDEGARFRAAREAAGNPVCFAHNSYLINLAAPNEPLYRKSIEAMIDELRRCAVLCLPGLVAHPGMGVGQEEAGAIARIVGALDEILDRTADLDVEVWLETTAGQGSSIGCRFDHLARIRDGVKRPGRIGVCLDTCHVFAAGYDLRTTGAWKKTMNEFRTTVGFDALRAVHVNDSKGDLGSRLDRHERLGNGKLGPGAFRLLMNDDRFAAVPKVLETPKGDDGKLDWENLAFLIGCLG